MHISLHISCLILIMGYCKYILFLNKPRWNFLLLAIWTVAMCKPRCFYSQTNAIMTNGVLMKHYNPVEFRNFFHLNISDQQTGWIALGTPHVHRFGFCVIIMYVIISQWMGSLQNAISLPNVTGLLFLSVWNCKQRFKTHYSIVSCCSMSCATSSK